jgi:hypothetical protein
LTEPTLKGVVTCELGVLPLIAGRYHISLWLGDVHLDSHVEMDALSFEVIDRNLWAADRTPTSNMAPLWWPAKFRVNTHGPSLSLVGSKT